MATAAEKERLAAQLELEKNRIALESAARATQFLLSDARGAELGTNIGQENWQANYRKYLTQVTSVYRKLL